MLKIIKFLKPFTISVIIVIGLLFTQAMSDLALPEYMSDIVNTGISQGGIESSIPKVIRKSEFEKLMFFLSDEDKIKISSYYTLLDKNELSKDLYNKYVEDYPLLKKEALYKLKSIDESKLEETKLPMGKAMLVLYGITSGSLKEMNVEMPFEEGLIPS